MVIPSGVVVLTDRRLAARPLTEVVAAAVRGGAGWVVLREKDLGYAERRALADSLRAVVPAGRLVIAGPDPLGGDAVHLSSSDPVPSGVGLVGRSCHGTPQLSTEDYVTLSPVYLTRTKPGYGPALGPERAAVLAGGVPWLALGGVDSAQRAAACAVAGARGIAVLGAVMGAEDPESVTRTLHRAFTQAAQSRRDQDLDDDGVATGAPGRMPATSGKSAGRGDAGLMPDRAPAGSGAPAAAGVRA